MNDAADRSTGATARVTFPVGYHRLHPDTSLNFQMNRWFGCVGEPGMLEEMRVAAPRIATYADWTREFVALAERASKQGHVLRAGFYWRSAEFFMRADDPARATARDRFLGAVQAGYSAELGERVAVPYHHAGRLVGQLSAYRFTPSRAKGTIVLFGGFDSYIEELTAALIYLRDAGYDVIAFDGPGQGRALDDGLPMTAAWHEPVGAVLDYFGVERVTLIGLSLGGCLALRAAAAEPRVARVVAFDVLTDFLDVVLRQTSASVRRALRLLLRLRAARGVNWLVARAARRSPVVQWGIEQGMHVTGTTTAFDFLQSVRQYRTTGVSASVRQDVLLLAGRADHYVPIEQWHRQIEMLEHARSVTARLFTADEHAENHCQVGNQGLALRTIVQWLDGIGVEHSPES